MAKQVEALLIGADISKAEVVFSVQGRLQPVPNDRGALRAWLRSLSGPARIAVEATSTFHLGLVEEAHAQGHTVYVVDGYRLSRYRESVGGRAKTDDKDAELLLRYLEREGRDLRPWTPPPAGYALLQRLLHRRAVIVQTRVTLAQSLGGLPELKTVTRGLMQRFDHLDQLIQKRIAQASKETGLATDADRCQAIEGVGPMTATALANAFRRGAFRSSDAFIAFLGLDVRVRESGTYRGKRRLTKQGDSEIRRLLFNAAMAARRFPQWQPIYARYVQRGLKPTQALVILARKLARVAFALMRHQSEYQPKMA